MKIITILYCLICSAAMYSQNLVRNPSFEDYESPSQDVFYAKDWFATDISTIDYYTEKCPYNPVYKSFTYMCESTHSKYFGYIPPYNGIAYIGMVLIGWNGIMEHYTGLLSQSLVKDSIYDISFYIRYGGDICWICSKSIEVLFTKEKLQFQRNNYKYLFSKGKIFRASLIFDIQKANDTRKWVKCSAKYKAKGGEQFMTFGLFSQEDGNKLIKLFNEYNKKYLDYSKQRSFVSKHEVFPIYPNTNCKQHKEDRENRVCAYYFIDDVSVTIDSKVKPDFTFDE